jgi:hypothetical protein
MLELRSRVIFREFSWAGEEECFMGRNTVHTETDAHPYGRGIEKYRVTVQQELNSVLTIQQSHKKFI